MSRATRLAWRLSICLGVLGAATRASADQPALERIAIYPTNIVLRTAGARQRVIVQGVSADGITYDVTDNATLEF
ncbi:MAG: hypothetical protein KDA33_17825, partial [Phycisphaerales bacterium]|nr:hypothetical protein [Phycisphaerales bacterium]